MICQAAVILQCRSATYSITARAGVRCLQTAQLNLRRTSYWLVPFNGGNVNSVSKAR